MDFVSLVADLIGIVTAIVAIWYGWKNRKAKNGKPPEDDEGDTQK